MVPAPAPPIAKLDFETYSEAGRRWVEAEQKWRPLIGARVAGIQAVGLAAYLQHPSTEVLTLSYRVPGAPVRRWTPSAGHGLPWDLIAWIADGGLLEAHNCMFERLCIEWVCIPRYGWPIAPRPEQWRCSMATARVNSLPGGLDELGDVLRLSTRKDKEGKRLLKKFAEPRNPTKKDPRRRIMPHDDPADFENLCLYCDRDVETEEAAGEQMPPMTADELSFWLIDQAINHRGVAIDRQGVRDMCAIVDACMTQYAEECRQITGGIGPAQVVELVKWLNGRGCWVTGLDAEQIEETLARPAELRPEVARVLTLRQLTASASVKKLYAMDRMACDDDRLRNLYNHHGARTGRPTGADVQPTNLPKAGPDLYWDTSGMPYGRHLSRSPWNGEPSELARKTEWTVDAADVALSVMATRDLKAVEYIFGDALLTVSGCVRPSFIAPPGRELISSDYTAIEAVCIAALSGCQWRMDTFERREDIYLASIGRSTNTPLQVYQEYRAANGKHHPDRHLGKIQELSLGYGGWLGALKAFGAVGDDETLKRQILAWRDASPEIVELWGGQGRGFPGSYHYKPELYGLEGAAVYAISHPGEVVDMRGVRLYMRRGALIMRLLSGRELTYHEPVLIPSDRRAGEKTIVYRTWNTNPKMGAPGWVAMDTYGGKLAENLTQATAHDVQRFGIVNLMKAGYFVVLHIYDEDVAEIPEGFGSIEEFESIMSIMPPWAQGWPIRAGGGWRGKRYRKD